MAAGAHRRSIATPSSIYPGRRRWCLPRLRWRRRARVDLIRASRYEIDGVTIEKSVVMPARRNIVHISFRLIGADRPVGLQLRPFVNFRRLEAPVNEPLGADYQLLVRGQRYEISAGPDLPTLRLMMNGCEGSAFTADGGSRRECLFLIEAQRGYEARG